MPPANQPTVSRATQTRATKTRNTQTPAAPGPATRAPVRRTRRREATRERVLLAATDVFAERGFHGASVEDICERAGFTRGAFYSNFATKDELVMELYEQHARRLSARVEALSSRTDLDPEQILAAVLDFWSESPTTEAQWYLLQVEFTLHAVRDKAAGRAWAGQQGKVREELVTLVERLAARHGVTLSVTPEEFVRLAQAIYQGGMSQHLLQPRTVRRGGLERRFLPLVFEAVTAS